MPAFLTHKIAADRIRDLITRPEAARVIDDHEDAYYSGAQGGDYFYSYKYYSMWAGYRYKMFGWALHRVRIQRFFHEAALYAGEQVPADVTKAFILGYTTHYALDMHVHPLIREVGPGAMTSHNIVESALDCMYAMQNGVDPWSFDKAQFVHDTHVPGDEIDAFFQAMMDRLYIGFTLPPSPYHITYAYLEKMQRMLQKTDRLSMLKRDVRDAFTLCKTRCLTYMPYEEIRDLFDYERLFGRLSGAEAHAGRLIDTLAGYWYDGHDLSSIDEAFYNINMNGVPITPLEVRKPFQKLYKKAPIV